MASRPLPRGRGDIEPSCCSSRTNVGADHSSQSCKQGSPAFHGNAALHGARLPGGGEGVLCGQLATGTGGPPMTVMPRAVDKAADAQARLISETLAAFAHDLAPAAIPPHVRERARHLMLDATGIAFASGRYDFAHKAMTGIAGLGGEGNVPVIGLPARLPP